MKSLIIEEIIATIQNQCNQNRGLGFVKKDEATGKYYKVSHFLAREKTTQSFRDAMKDQRKQKQKQ
jgi:hypothetical protein